MFKHYKYIYIYIYIDIYIYIYRFIYNYHKSNNENRWKSGKRNQQLVSTVSTKRALQTATINRDQRSQSPMQTIQRPPQIESLFSNTTVFSTTTHEKTWRMERRVPSKRLSPCALLSSSLCWVGPKDSATLRLHPASGAWIILPS